MSKIYLVYQLFIRNSEARITLQACKRSTRHVVDIVEQTSQPSQPSKFCIDRSYYFYYNYYFVMFSIKVVRIRILFHFCNVALMIWRPKWSGERSYPLNKGQLRGGLSHKIKKSLTRKRLGQSRLNLLHRLEVHFWIAIAENHTHWMVN